MSSTVTRDPHRIVTGEEFGWKSETLPYRSIPELFRLRVKELGDATMMRQKELGIWRSYTWSEVSTIVHEIGAGLVSLGFEPGARTNWHTHPLGQTLYVVSGTGRVQTWGGPVREIHAGDSIWIPPLEKHWHGATPTQGMVHIAIHESLDGTHVTWLEKVTDAEFSTAPVAR